MVFYLDWVLPDVKKGFADCSSFFFVKKDFVTLCGDYNFPKMKFCICVMRSRELFVSLVSEVLITTLLTVILCINCNPFEIKNNLL